MDVKKTIQLLVENAAQHDARRGEKHRDSGDSLITLTSVVKTLADHMDDMQKEMRARCRGG